MNPDSFAPRFRRSVLFSCGIAALFAGGALAATATSSSAAPLDDCVVSLLVPCPTISTPALPTISVPTVSVPSGSTTAPTPPPASGSTTPAAPASGASASESFSYTIVRTSARRTGRLRWIDVRLSLSDAATVVTVLHRRDVPSLVAVRTGRAGSNTFAVAVPTRVRAGRYTLKLVFGTATAHHTATRPISIPK
jgi:hypothetical protein